MQSLPWSYQFQWYLLLAFALAATLADVMQHPSWRFIDKEICGMSYSDRIIGGKNARLGEFPWIARIGYSEWGSGRLSYKCGGTLINQVYVITAAHCVADLPHGTKVAGIRLGEHNTATDPDCEDGYCAEPVQDYEPASIIVHKDYNNPMYTNDIALIRLNKPVRYNGFVFPICMPRASLLNKNFIGDTAEVAGWGIDNIYRLTVSSILQTVKLPVIETENCETAFSGFVKVDEQQLCVGGKVGKDSCTGDSGGPLMKVEALDGPPKYYLLGIVSFGVKHCGASLTPAVYTKVSYFITWILNNMLP